MCRKLAIESYEPHIYISNDGGLLILTTAGIVGGDRTRSRMTVQYNESTETVLIETYYLLLIVHKPFTEL